MKMTDDQYLENLPTLDDNPPRGPTHLISCDNSVSSPEGKPKNFWQENYCWDSENICKYIASSFDFAFGPQLAK